VPPHFGKRQGPALFSGGPSWAGSCT
jgi:hypothetical protein